MNFRVLRKAQQEIDAATEWYGAQRFGLDDEFLTELTVAYQFIQDHAELIPRVEHYAGRHVVRRHHLKRFPYLVVVAFRDQELLVVAVAHIRRRQMFWLNRLN